MKSKLLGIRDLPQRSELVVLIAMLALFVFYYGLRTDEIGVRTAGRGWSCMTEIRIPVFLHFIGSGLILGLIPIIAARRFIGSSWSRLGLGWGDRKAGLGFLVVGIPLAVVAGKVASGSEVMRSVYPLDPALTAEPSSFIPYSLVQFTYYFGWEVLFRGVLLLGLKNRFSFWGANMFQTALSVTAHFGRPFAETFSAVPAGLLFGWMAARTGSVWYLLIIHWVIGVSMNWFIIS